MSRERASKVDALVSELEEARREFGAALADVDTALLSAPGLIGDWSAAQVVAHLGYWAGHATEALHRAELGEFADFGHGEPEVDETNAVVARVAAETDPGTVLQREEIAYEALLARLRVVDPETLDERDGEGDTLEQVLRDDGSDHYREHTADLRAWFTGTDDTGADGDD
jgi:hypothetical protein